MSRFIRSITTRPALVLSLVIGFAAGAIWPAAEILERLLLGWCLTTIIYVFWVSFKLGRMSLADLKDKAGELDEGAVTILALSMLAAAASFAGVVVELGAIHKNPAASHLTLPLMVATIICSWFFVHTVFAVHYAHVFYSDLRKLKKETLDFGGDTEAPDYWDFVYFSVTIGASSATSDTNLHSRMLRRIVAAHAVFSFFFNATVLALAINIAAGLLGSN